MVNLTKARNKGGLLATDIKITFTKIIHRLSVIAFFPRPLFRFNLNFLRVSIVAVVAVVVAIVDIVVVIAVIVIVIVIVVVVVVIIIIIVAAIISG